MRKIPKVLNLKYLNKQTNKQTTGKIEIKNLTETTAELYFYGDIVDDSWYAWWDDESQWPMNVKEILDEAEGKDLNIYVNSGGGHVFGGMAIYNMLKRFEGKKTVYVDGLAASIASVIALAGDKIVIPKTAYMMIHKPMGGQWGNAIDMRKMADTLDRIEEGIINVYQENIKEGIDIDNIKQMIHDETWLTGEAAAEIFNVEVSEVVATACVSNLVHDYKNTPSDIKKDKLENTTRKEAIADIEQLKNQLLSEIDLI